MSKASLGLCLLICVAFVLSAVAASGARLPMNQFGNYWVQTHEFQIMNQCVFLRSVTSPQTELGKLFELHTTGFRSGDAGAIALARPLGMNAHSCLWVTAPNVSGDTIDPGLLTTIGSFSTRDYSDAWYVDDEPKESDFHAIAIVTDLLKTKTPKALIYNNISFRDVNPSFLNHYLSTVKPDMLMCDTYPYYLPTKPSWFPENPDWFSIAMTTRSSALAQGIPYFTWLQSFQGKPGTDNYWRFPSESEMRAEAYAILTMGYKGISWFSYDNGDDGCCEWLVDQTTRVPNKHYYWVRAIDSEIQKLGVYLRFLKSTDVRFVPNKGNPTPAGLVNWSIGAGGDKYIKGITLSTQAQKNRDALVGFFTDSNGRQCFMLQNLYRAPGLSANAGSSTIMVNFSRGRLPVPGTVYRLDRATGKNVAVRLVNGTQLQDTLPGGTADLYSYTPFDLSMLRH